MSAGRNRKHSVTNHDSLDADIHPVGPSAQRTRGKVVVISATSDSKIRAVVLCLRVSTLSNRSERSLRGSGYRDRGRQAAAGILAILGDCKLHRDNSPFRREHATPIGIDGTLHKCPVDRIEKQSTEGSVAIAAGSNLAFIVDARLQPLAPIRY